MSPAGRYRGQLGVSLGSSAAGTVVVLAHARDELPNTEVLDHSLKDSVVAAVDLFDLDLRLLGDEVHSALSFLL